MATTYTWLGLDGNIETASNWSPGIDLFGGATTSNDSLLFDGSNGASPYVATYGLVGTNEFHDLVINFSGADISADPTSEVYQITVDNSIQVLSGTLDLGDYTEIVNGGTATQFLIDGTLQGTGLINASLPAITGSGHLLAQLSGPADITTLEFDNEISGTLTGEIQSGATMMFNGAVDAGFVVTVDDAANGSVALGDLPDFHGTVAALGVGAGANNNPGSFIDVTGLNAGSVTGVSFSGGVITINAPTGGGTIAIAGTYTGDFVNYRTDGSGGTDFFFSDTVCFVAGTKILTPAGDVAVETLSAGDDVIAVIDGQRVARPVKWIGYRKLDLDRQAKSAGLAPIRIKRGAMADGLPARDLLVSPPHCLFIDGKLIPAKLLVNEMSIEWDTTLKTVEYYHIELDHHAVIIAEGVETESYLDTGNRAFFSNAGLALLLHPEFHVNAGLRCWATDACAPLAVSPAAVLPVWRPLADRAVTLGYTSPTRATTADADIHLLADGHRVDPINVAGQVHSFIVPAAVKSLTLASRSVRPNVLIPYLDDPRQIGVAVRGVVIRGLTGRTEFSADHPALTRGWHAAERDDTTLWRWTTGNGALPVSTEDNPVIVEVTIGETTTYLVDDRKFEACIAA
jgi:Hint domain